MSVELDILTQLEKRLVSMERTLIDLSSDILYLKGKIEENNKAIESYIDFKTGLKYGFKFFKHVQVIAVWIASVAGASGVIFVIWKFALIQTLMGAPK